MQNKSNYNIGDKIIFNGTDIFWYEFAIRFANKYLKIGEVYTIDKIFPASFTGITLEEFPNELFNSNWFTKI